MDTAVDLPMESRVRRRRVKMSRSVRVRPSDFQTAHFDEIRVTVSASPAGLYFVTWRDSYYKGMRVFLTFPYSATMDSRFSEYVGEVVSIESLGTSRYGIGVRFVTQMNPQR